MKDFPSERTVARVREKYPAGTRVRLVRIDDLYRHLPRGMTGTVIAVDDIATVHIRWDNGCTLGAAYGVDSIERI